MYLGKRKIRSWFRFDL